MRRVRSLIFNVSEISKGKTRSYYSQANSIEEEISKGEKALTPPSTRQEIR
jgi:hypothetical protein